jgi:peroxiredoxin
MPSQPTNFPKLLPYAVLLLGLAWIALSASSTGQSQEGQSAPATGFYAPDFTLPSLDGQSYSLSELRGRPILLNLWASWCLPCRAEMPALQRVYEEHQAQGFIVLAVNATNQDSPGAAAAFVEELGLSYPILLDEEGTVSRLYGLRALPTTFFIDAEGKIIEVIVGGPLSEALLAIRVEELLKDLP